MTLETEIYQILRKHRLSLKKREEVIVDLVDFINRREEVITVTHCCKSEDEQYYCEIHKEEMTYDTNVNEHFCWTCEHGQQ